MKPKIKICIPCYLQSLYEISPAKKSIDTLSTKNWSFDYKVFLQTGACIASLRNILINNNTTQLIKQKIEGGFTHILFIDSDIDFIGEQIEQLLSHKKRIASGVYLRKCKEMPGWEAWKTNEIGLNTNVITSDTTGLFKLDGGAGLGFCLIETNVFEQLEYPWFAEDIVRVRDRAEKRAEDGYFFYQVKKEKIEFWLDCDCQVKHFEIKPKLEDVTMQEVKKAANEFNPEYEALKLFYQVVSSAARQVEMATTLTKEINVRDNMINNAQKKIVTEETKE